MDIQESLTAFIPGDVFYAERKYALSTIFKHILGIDISFSEKKKQDKSENIIIKTDTAKSLVFRDDFFSSFNSVKEYLTPKGLDKAEKIINRDLNILQTGENTAEPKHRNDSILPVDLCCLPFFMLTRWEEYVCAKFSPHKLDHLKRFPSKESLAFKLHFLDRPVVNEMAEYVKNAMKKAGIKIKCQYQGFRVSATHDIDTVYFPCSIKSLGGDLLKRKDPALFLKRFAVKCGLKANPYDSFSKIMDLSEKAGLISEFYFLACTNKHETAEKDSLYQTPYSLDSKLFSQTIREIEKRNHIAGIHPGFGTQNNQMLFNSEIKRLKQRTALLAPDLKIHTARQHFLLFSAPYTWRIQTQAGIKTDSTLGFSKHEGFRCGTGCEFPVFDFLDSKQLDLIERPLIVMDTTLASHRKLSVHQALEVLRMYMRLSQKYKMPYTVLFHNSNINKLLKPWDVMHQVYFEFMNRIICSQ